MALQIDKNLPLSLHTTIGLGGNARFFTTCRSVEEIKEALEFARGESLSVQIIGAGSNLIFPDDGFDGLIIKTAPRGITVDEKANSVVVTAQAGENWDAFVAWCVECGYGGIECLSGIPGLVGATPMQNVGAYGQEVKNTIVSLTALDRHTCSVVEFANADCQFEYRQSRFKSVDADRYIILSVTFRFRKNDRPVIRYAELQSYIDSNVPLHLLESGRPALEAVRSAVLSLRRKKSMVLDPADPNTRSVGSFFTNPVLSPQQYEALLDLWKRSGKSDAIPTFSSPNGVKVPAAWLVERAGFHKGLRKGGVGISANHALALVNHGGTTRELLELAAEIQSAVFKKFGVRLEREPIVVQ